MIACWNQVFPEAHRGIDINSSDSATSAWMAKTVLQASRCSTVSSPFGIPGQKSPDSVHPEIGKFGRDQGAGKFNRRHTVDIPRIKFLAQRRYRQNFPISGWTLSNQNSQWQIVSGPRKAQPCTKLSSRMSSWGYCASSLLRFENSLSGERTSYLK